MVYFERTGLWRLLNPLPNSSFSESPKLDMLMGTTTVEFSHWYSLDWSWNANCRNRKTDCRWKYLQPKYSCNTIENLKSHHARLFHLKVITSKMDHKKKIIKNWKILLARYWWSKNSFFTHFLDSSSMGSRTAGPPCREGALSLVPPELLAATISDKSFTGHLPCARHG